MSATTSSTREAVADQLADLETRIAVACEGLPDRGERNGGAVKFAGERLHKTVTAFASRDLTRAQQTDREDDAVDRLNREVFEATLKLGAAPDQRELALKHVLIARSLERVGDNAVDIAEQAAFLIIATVRDHDVGDEAQVGKRPPNHLRRPHIPALPAGCPS